MSTVPFVLIHSPLVGTFTWQLVAKHLQAEGHGVFTPELVDDPQSDIPLWQQEVNSIEFPEQEIILVGHSGAGALLPAISARFDVQGYIFVDAVLLFGAATRLEMLDAEDVAFASEFEAFLRKGGQFPNWQDEDLRLQIPDDDVRQKLMADLRPRSLSFFIEQLEASEDWDVPPCAYIQLSETYRTYADQAEARGWTVFRRDAHHFEMLTNPATIAQLLVQIKQQFTD
ncbi:MAG: alpha/beta hydrolase [Chloroflexi bacterium]|nr:alpha/beta hydrolase [Chloroflexota bacterium]